MENKEFAKELEERTLKFTVMIITLSAKLQNTPEARIVKTQITKCGSSTGANYREANEKLQRTTTVSLWSLIEKVGCRS